MSDGIESLLKIAARRDSADMLEVLSLAFANLSAANADNCRSVVFTYFHFVSIIEYNTGRAVWSLQL